MLAIEDHKKCSWNSELLLKINKGQGDRLSIVIQKRSKEISSKFVLDSVRI